MGLQYSATQSSGLLTADALVEANPCLLHTVTLVPAAADSTLTIYDNNAAAAAGTVLAKIFVLATTASQTIHFTIPVRANKGLYADVAGAAAGYIIHFEKTF